MKKVIHFTLLSFLYLLFFASVLIYNNKDKIKMSYIVIINLVMIIKKRSGGKDVMLLGDFALEPSKNVLAVFSKNDFADCIEFKQV